MIDFNVTKTNVINIRIVDLIHK